MKAIVPFIRFGSPVCEYPPHCGKPRFATLSTCNFLRSCCAALALLLTIGTGQVWAAVGVKGSWDSWAYHDISSGSCEIELPANATYEFVIDVDDTGYSYTNQVFTTTSTKFQIYSDNSNCKITTAEAGTYIFKTWYDNGRYMAVYYPQARLKKNTVIYFDARNSNTDRWRAAAFDAKFSFKYYDNDEGQVEDKFSASPVESWVHYVTVPNNENVGGVQIMRMKPNDHSEQWNYTNLCHAWDRSSSAQNCLYVPDDRKDWADTWVPAWTTYCPPLTAVTLADNSTTIIAGTSGNGTNANPYIVPADGSIKVRSTSTSAVDDSNMMPYYHFKVDNATAQNFSSANTYTKSDLTNNHVYIVNVEAKNYYNSTYGTTLASGTTLYYKALNQYSVTHTLSHVTATAGATGSKVVAYQMADYNATFTAAEGYTLPATINVTSGGSDITASCGWVQSTGALTIGAGLITGDIVITINALAPVAEPLVAPTAPAYSACQVHSIYSDTYASVGMSFADWGSGSSKTDRTVAGTNMYKVTLGNDFFGLEINGKIDASAYEYIHMDVWTPTAASFRFSPICFNYSSGGNETEQYKANIATTAGAWTSIDIPVSYFTDLGLTMHGNFQLKIDQCTGSYLWITNIYYYNTASCPSYTPVAGTHHFGTAQRQNVALYKDEGMATGRHANTSKPLAQRFDYYIVDCGEQMLAKAVTRGKLGTGPYDQMVQVWNNEKTGFVENKLSQHNAMATEGFIRIGDADQYKWNGHTATVPMNIYANFQNQNTGLGYSEFFDYQRGYINNPNSDHTAPTLTDASASEETNWYTVSFTGGNDNSGQWFYYVEDAESCFFKVSLEDTIRIPKSTDGKVYNLSCYTVDFNGNLSAPLSVRITMPLNSTTNLALKKPVYMGRNAVYVTGTNYSESNDGNYGSRWGTGEHPTAEEKADYSNEWWYVDLQSYYRLESIKIWFETACSDNFVLQACETLPADAADDTQWRTIYTNTAMPQTGNAPENVNTYDVSGSVARYVRIKSYHNSYDGGQWGFSMWEFEVYGTAVVEKDASAPVVTTAEVSAIVNTNQLQLHLVADDGSKVFRITDAGGYVCVKTADADDYVTMDNAEYTYCTPYTFTVQAMDDAANLSAGVPCTGSVSVPADLDLTDFPGITVTATSSGDAGAGWATAYAIDNADNTYWAGRNSSGQPNGEQWLDIDLSQQFGISSVQIAWNSNTTTNFYIEGKHTTGDYYILKHVTSAPAEGHWAEPGRDITYETYTLPDHICVQHIRLRAFNTNNEMAIRDVKLFGSCGEEYAKPIMTEAELQDVVVTASSVAAHIHVGSYDDSTDPASIRYNVQFTAGGLADRNGLTAIDGVLTLDNLTEGTEYTVRIEAVDGNGNVSENYEEVTFSAMVNLYYFTSANTGGVAVWAAVLGSATEAEARRFKTTDVDGIYKYTIELPAEGDVYYRLYYDESSQRVSEVLSYWSNSDNQNAASHHGETIEVYAKDKNHFVSIFDDLKVYGDAVYAATEGSAWTMTYNNDHTFTWQGRVKAGTNAFRILVNNNGTGYTDNSRVRIMDADADFDNASGWTHARLTFDMETWTYTWEEVAAVDMCQRTGGKGSGLTQGGALLFKEGESYEQFTYVYDGKWIVEVSFAGGTIDNAYLQPFTSYAGDGVTEFPMTNMGGDFWMVSLDAAQVGTLYKLGNLARYTVKLVIHDGGIRQTDVHYYDFTDFASGANGCAPDYFDIYHYDDASAADAPVDARTSYDGGRILQPIRYFRHFEHTDWCALSVPFEVSKVVVEEEGTEYPLYPNFNNGTLDVEGYYWLRTFEGAVTLGNFKAAWHQMTVSTAETDDATLATLVKPIKNTPYVIAFPDADYYRTNWVIFYGSAGQEIASSEDADCGTGIMLTSDDYDYEKVKLQRNNMMKPTGTKTNIYTLDEGDDYYTRKTTVVPAFESYVVGTEQVRRRYTVLRANADSTPDPDSETTTDLENRPTTAGWEGEIYTSMGVLVTTFAGRDAMEQSLDALPTGVYVVRCGKQVNKVVVP